jgi:hypothetical protein
MKQITAAELEFERTLMTLPPAERAITLCRVGDIVWAAIRPQVSTKLAWVGDTVWRLLKADLIKKAERKVCVRCEDCVRWVSNSVIGYMLSLAWRISSGDLGFDACRWC